MSSNVNPYKSSGVNPNNKKNSGVIRFSDYHDRLMDSMSRKPAPVGMVLAPKNLLKSAVAFEVTRHSEESYGGGNHTITSEKSLLNDGNGMYAAPDKLIPLFMILFIYNMITC